MLYKNENTCVCAMMVGMCVWQELPPICICRIVRVMSCLCLAEMSIYFCFGEFHANTIYPIFMEGHAEFLYDFDICMHGNNYFAYILYRASN